MSQMQETNMTRPARFLLVEDDAGHADLLRRALGENRVYNALEHVRDGGEALERLRSSAGDAERIPDVVLLDLKLPTMDGPEVLERLSRDDDLPDVPVVILATSEGEIRHVRDKLNGARACLVKPLGFDEFNQLVQRLGLWWGVWTRPPA